MPAGVATVVLLAGAVAGLFFLAIVVGAAALANAWYLAAAAPAGAFASSALWWMEWSGRPRQRAARGAAPFTALFIPAFFFPDYLIGSGPPAAVSAAIFCLSLACFCALRFLLFSDDGRRLEERLGRHSLGLVVIATVLTALLFCLTAILKYRNFAFPGSDLGNLVQSYWTALHGRLFWNTDISFPGGSHFGRHFSPIMFLVVPFFALAPHALTVVFLNAIAVSSGAVLVYFLARDVVGRYGALCFGLCYLLYPGVDYFVWHMCYPMNIAPLLLFLALFFYKKERFASFCLFCVLSCAVREEISLTVLVFSLYALLQKRGGRWVAFPAALGVLWFATAMGFIIPAFGRGSLWEFYDNLGGNVGGITNAILRKPLSLLPSFFAPDYMRLVYLILMPFAVALPLMSLEMILSIPALVIIALSSRPDTRYVTNYFYLPLIPFVFAATMATVGRIPSHRDPFRLGRNRGVTLMGTFLLFLALTVFTRGSLVSIVSGEIARPYNARAGRPYTGALRRIIALVPPEARVFAPRYMKPHFARRSFVSAEFPSGADYVIIDSRTDDPFTMKIQNKASLRGIGGNPEFVQLFEEEGVKLYRRVGQCRPTVQPGR